MLVYAPMPIAAATTTSDPLIRRCLRIGKCLAVSWRERLCWTASGAARRTPCSQRRMRPSSGRRSGEWIPSAWRPSRRDRRGTTCRPGTPECSDRRRGSLSPVPPHAWIALCSFCWSMPAGSEPGVPPAGNDPGVPPGGGPPLPKPAGRVTPCCFKQSANAVRLAEPLTVVVVEPDAAELDEDPPPHAERARGALERQNAVPKESCVHQPRKPAEPGTHIEPS